MTAKALARPITAVPPTMTGADVYSLMARDETLFAVPIVEDGAPIGLIDRIALMSQFARPYWREVYSPRPITKLMDPDPVIVDISMSGEAICGLLARKRRALNAGFILTQAGRYHGVGSTVDLLQLIADNAQQRAQELSFAQAEIQAFNETLEHRVLERTSELRTAQQEIVRKERLAALGQLTATVAHELRNPLSSIRNTVFTLKEALRANSLDFGRPIGRMERSIARCDNIISELLDFTRAQQLQLRSVAADAWLAETIGDLQIPADISLMRDFGAGDVRLDLDGDRMRRVVINLIDNALHALADHRGPRRIVVSSRANRGGYELIIEDSGPGIPADHLNKVFEPLFSTKSFGTGLGLPTVKQIIEQHRGTIALANGPMGGARATIRLRAGATAEIAA